MESPIPSSIISLAQSPAWRDRVAAGRALIDLLDRDISTDLLVKLLNDPENTAVTTATADGLVSCATPFAIQALLDAYAVGDEESGFHIAIAIGASSNPAVRREIETLGLQDAYKGIVVDLQRQLEWRS